MNKPVTFTIENPTAYESVRFTFDNYDISGEQLVQALASAMLFMTFSSETINESFARYGLDNMSVADMENFLMRYGFVLGSKN